VEDTVGGKANSEVMSSPSPLVSILMPTYNAEKFISEAINSILSQDYSNWELLILNDASTDSTQAIIDGFEDNRITVFLHSENQGYLISCNKLFSKTKGDFVTFLDADDVCSANRLRICLNIFEEDSELDFLTTNHSKITESGETISIQSEEIDYRRYAIDPEYYPTICCATTFLKKELLTTVNGYRPLFNKVGGEDYFWLWELSRTGNGKHLNISLYDYRSHPNQTSTMHDDELHLFIPELTKTLRVEFRSSLWNDEQAAVLEQAIREQFVNSAYNVNLRKAQFSLNGNQHSFWNYAVTCLRNVRELNQIRPITYLFYSWLIRTGRNANR
jgi:glycosyltransferase involved in cell wall biosynthesis